MPRGGGEGGRCSAVAHPDGKVAYEPLKVEQTPGTCPRPGEQWHSPVPVLPNLVFLYTAASAYSPAKVCSSFSTFRSSFHAVARRDGSARSSSCSRSRSRY